MISAIILTSLAYGVATALKDSESEDRTNSKMPKYLVDVTADLCCITYDECMKTATDLEALFGYKVTDVDCQTPEMPTADPTATDPVTAEPTAVPTEGQTADTLEPTATPTDVLTAEPSAPPTEPMTAEPTAAPSEGLTAEPTAVPTEMMTAEPTAAPIDSVTAEPTAAPTADPTAAPTELETTEPTEAPTSTPTESPVDAPAPGPASGAITLDWTAGLSDASARTLDAAPGTVITFEWSSGHNVNIMKDEAALNSCSFRGSQRIGGNSGPVTFTVPEDAVPGSKIYFACAVGFHCLAGQHLTITVSGDSSASVPSPSATVTPAPTRGGIFGRRRLPSADKQAWRVTYTFAVDTLREKEELAKKAITDPNDGDNLDKILAALNNLGVETFKTASVTVTEGVTCKWVEGDTNTEDGTYVGNVDMLRSCEDRVRRVCPEATKAFVKEDANGRKMCYCHVGELEIGSDALEGKTCLINKEVELPPITCEEPTFVKTCVDKLVKTGGCILYSEVSSEEELMAVTQTVFDKVDEKCLACDIVDDAVANKCKTLTKTKKPRDDDDGPKLIHIAILAGVALLIGCFVALVLFQPTCCCCKPKRDPVVDHYIKAELSQ